MPSPKRAANKVASSASASASAAAPAPAPGSLFDVVSQVGFYYAYHHNAINQYIHFVFVPTIVWASAVLLAALPLPAGFQWSVLGVPVGNVSSVLCGTYLLYYLVLEWKAALMYAPFFGALWFFANYFYVTNANPLYVATIAEIVAWAAQFIGHGVFEGRRPALVDNLVQSLVLAPFFVWLELLFALGYRPDLRRKLEADVKARLTAAKAK